MSKTPIWTTHDKERIPIAEMSDNHLLNTHRYLCQQLDEYEEVRVESMYIAGPPKIRDTAWSASEWLVILAGECERRGLDQLAEPGECWDAWGEPVWNDEPITEIPNNRLIRIEYELRIAISVVVGISGGQPRGDAAQDAFWQEFHLAFKMSVEAYRWLPVVRSEMARRGLEPEEE